MPVNCRGKTDPVPDDPRLRVVVLGESGRGDGEEDGGGYGGDLAHHGVPLSVPRVGAALTIIEAVGPS